MKSLRNVLIVSEGSPGHVTQSRGLVNCIAARCEIDQFCLETRPKFGGFMRAVIRHCVMGGNGRRLPDWFLGRFLGVDLGKVMAFSPDLVISSGGRSVFAARSLSERLGVPFVYIGERKPYPEGWFDIVFTPSSTERGVCDEQIGLIPTSIDKERARGAAAGWRGKPEGRLWTMVIGGDSRSHRYGEEEWLNLAKRMNEMATKYQIRWLVSTSRRTGGRVEKILRDALTPENVGDAIWWTDGNVGPGIATYFGAAERVFVSQDSVSMVSEAVACRVDTVVFHPREVYLGEKNYISGYLGNLEEKRLIQRLSIEALDKCGDVKQPSGFGGLKDVDYMADYLFGKLGFGKE